MTMKSKEQMIHEAAMEILQDVGVVFHNDEAVRVLKENGIRVYTRAILLGKRPKPFVVTFEYWMSSSQTELNRYKPVPKK